eukprot:s96_g24.t1
MSLGQWPATPAKLQPIYTRLFFVDISGKGLATLPRFGRGDCISDCWRGRQEFDPYIEEIKVACKTPAVLLEEANLQPSEVDILAIDAEGLDVQILKLFLKLPNFDPAVIFCEVTHVDPVSLDQLTQQLQGCGYRLGRATTEMSEDGFGDLELERQVQDRVRMTKITTDGKAEEVARAAVQDMERQIKILESIQSSLAGIESLGAQDLNRRMAYLERCTPEQPEQLPPVLHPMREAVLQERENCDLLRQINNLAPETEKYRAQFAGFKKSSEPRHRRRLSMMQKKENDIRKRNRKMRQACRELTVFREQVRIAREEASLPASTVAKIDG